LNEEERSIYYAKFNVDGLMRGDFNSRMSGYAIARQNGWMSANEIRALEDMNKIPSDQGGVYIY
jgi:phage portal protein BeeE